MAATSARSRIARRCAARISRRPQRIFRPRQTGIRRLLALRPLRPLPEPLPHVSPLGTGSGFAARAHPPDGAGGPGQARTGRIFRHAHRPLPRLPRLRDGLPVRRRIRQARRDGARANRAELQAALSFRASRAISFIAAASLSVANRHGGAISEVLSDARDWRRSRAAREFCACSDCRTANGCCRRSIRSFSSRLGKTFPAQGPRRARVALFAGCVAQVTFSELNRATIRVLQANGCEVVVPAGQVCCGALPAHAGVRDVARNLARTNFDAFSADDFDAIVTNAAGCGSTLKEYTHLFAADDPSTKRAAKFSRQDARRDRISRGAWPHRAAAERSAARHVSGFLPSCPRTENPRSAAQADSRGSRRRIRGNAACGSVLRLGRRLQRHGDGSVARIAGAENGVRVQQTNAQAIVTANPGCILQLRAGAAIHDTGQEVLHVVELLDRALARSADRLFLADQVAAALRAHPRGVHCARGHVAALAHAIRLRFAVHCERHFAVENDVRGQGRHACGPDKKRSGRPARRTCVRKTFRFELFPVILFCPVSWPYCCQLYSATIQETI